MILDSYLPIVNTGAVGAMLVVMVRWIKAKDKKSYELIDQMNLERKEMHTAHTELIVEVTKALTDKNHSDNALAEAVTKLTEELRRRGQV